MKIKLFACAAALCAILPTVALADDPNDPAMRSPAARAADRAQIRALNREELAYTRERDARYAQGWRTARSGDHEMAMADYARSREQYEQQMADWRRAVAACRQGDYSACDR